MLVGQRIHVEWSSWPSGALQEKTYDLAGFPVFYMACRKELNLATPEALRRRVESTLAPLIQDLKKHFRDAHLLTEGSFMALEVVRNDGEHVLFDLESYFQVSEVLSLERQEWLDQWIGVHLAEQEENLMVAPPEPQNLEIGGKLHDQ